MRVHGVGDVDGCDEAIGCARGHAGHAVQPHCCFSTAVGIAEIKVEISETIDFEKYSSQ